MLVRLLAFEFETQGVFEFAHVDPWGGHSNPAKRINANPNEITETDAKHRAGGVDRRAGHDDRNRWSCCSGIPSYGIRANAIAPGFHSTEMTMRTRNVSENADDFLKSVPLEFLAEADSLDKAALFLASDDSYYITGHNLVVNGGLSLRKLKFDKVFAVTLDRAINVL